MSQFLPLGRFLQIENWEDLVQHPEKNKGHDPDEEGAEEPFFKSFQVLGDKGEVVMHVPGKSEGKGLPSDDDIPPHHENPKKYQGEGQQGPANGNPGDQK